jgi:hypothetical protein
MKNLIVADWDRGTEWSVYDGSATCYVGRINFPEFIRNLPDNTVVVIEGAHLQPRGPLSVAQVYWPEEQEDLYKASENINIFAFPEILTFRAKNETGLGEPEEAIYKFVLAHPEISLMRWRLANPIDKLRWDYLNTIRNDCTVRLNIMRPDYKSDEVDRVRSWLERNYGSLSDLVKEVFGISFKKKLLFNKSRVMSVYVTCFDEHGNLRLNDNGKFIGLRTVWAVLKLHPYHRKAGTARSNLMYHTLRNLEGKKPGNKIVRTKFRRAIKDLVQDFRDLD